MNMKLSPGWILAWMCCTAAMFSSTVSADQYSDMVDGLRERRYFDFALLYLDQLAARTDLDPRVRQEIPYSKALVLLASSREARLPDDQLKQLDQAQAFLEQFAKDSPDHPKAGDANSQRADILLGKARVEIMQSRAPANNATRAEFQNRARTLIAQARQVFETAQQQHEANYQSYGSFVNQEKDREKYEAREQSLMQLISAMLNVGQCRYEEAQTYDAGTPEHKKILNQAASEFEQLHQRYRNYTGGLYARLFEGKCFDDQGDTQKAMGIYNELLDHEGNDQNLKKLQHKTLQFKLEALNRKTPPDSQLVIDMAAEWLKDNKAESRSQTGLAIQWEQAVAFEALGDQRDLVKADRDRAYRSARAAAQTINKFRSVYSDVSVAMIQRLDGKLGGKERKPETFEAAQSLGNQHFKDIQELRKQLEAATKQGKPAEEIQKFEQDLHTEMHDAAEMFQLALNLADKNDEPKQVATARLYLAYIHFWARRNYEAAILGEFVARTAPKDESVLAMDAAYIAMAAFVQAFNDNKAPVDTKGSDLGFVVRACEYLVNRWPETDRANDARMWAGRVYGQSKKPVEAASWYSKVPEVDSHYSEAQIAAGQGYWDGYRAAARLPQDQRPATEQLQQWQVAADKHLRTGIAKMTISLPTEGLPPAELMGAKFSLADILISQGKDAEAITILTADPHSVTKAVTVEKEEERPTTGVKKRVFAVEVYKLLLRAYIGNGKLDEARATMKTLETIAGGAAGGDITDLYVGLGKLLKEELDRMRAVGETDRFNALRTSFETFLNDVYQRKEGHSIGSLSWVGETYAALGEADLANVATATNFFDKAANAFQEIVRQTESNAAFATTDQIIAVKTRLIHALRMKKDFSATERLVTELLKQRKDDLKLQIEAAHLYQDWASEPGEEKKYLMAISGNPENQTLGFGPLSKRIANVTRGGRRPELRDSYFDTRLQTTLSRYKYALAQTATKDKRRELDKCEVELVAFASVTKDTPDERRAEFNGLFRKVREAINDPKRPVEDLKWTGDIAIDPKPETDDAADEKKAEPKAAAQPKQKPVAKAASGPDYVMWGLVLVGTIATFAVIFMLARKKKKQPLIKRDEPSSASFDFGDVPVPSKRKDVVSVGPLREKKVASTGKSSAAPTGSRPAGSPSGGKPATGAPTATRPQAVKPKPKPPPES